MAVVAAQVVVAVVVAVCIRRDYISRHSRWAGLIGVTHNTKIKRMMDSKRPQETRDLYLTNKRLQVRVKAQLCCSQSLCYASSSSQLGLQFTTVLLGTTI